MHSHLAKFARLGLALGVAMGALGLSGCAAIGYGNSEYGCKGYPEGVTCKSVREVYKATENRDSLTGPDQGPTTPRTHHQSRRNRESGPASSTTAGSSPASTPASGVAQNRRGRVSRSVNRPVAPYPDGKRPVRTPAKVMRIYVAPWVDKDETLHSGGHLYVEVEKRTWTIGEMPMKDRSDIHPLQIRRRNNQDSDGSGEGNSSEGTGGTGAGTTANQTSGRPPMPSPTGQSPAGDTQ